MQVDSLLLRWRVESRFSLAFSKFTSDGHATSCAKISLGPFLCMSRSAGFGVTWDRIWGILKAVCHSIFLKLELCSWGGGGRLGLCDVCIVSNDCRLSGGASSLSASWSHGLSASSQQHAECFGEVPDGLNCYMTNCLGHSGRGASCLESFRYTRAAQESKWATGARFEPCGGISIPFSGADNQAFLESRKRVRPMYSITSSSCACINRRPPDRRLCPGPIPASPPPWSIARRQCSSRRPSPTS